MLFLKWGFDPTKLFETDKSSKGTFFLKKENYKQKRSMIGSWILKKKRNDEAFFYLFVNILPKEKQWLCAFTHLHMQNSYI